jgi:hypothetical protein
MKVKLIKVEDDLGRFYTLDSKNKLPENYTLSKENCDDIFGVVDVYKLVNKKFPHDSDDTNIGNCIQDGRRNGAIWGFNKAMELNKDKVFTLEDMNKAIKYGFDSSDFYDDYIPTDMQDDFIQSIQQLTEIDVEIEMVDYARKLTSGGVEVMRINLDKPIPKLDTNGCLILRKL